MVYTNEIPRGYMRSPGQPQAIFAVEAHTDLLARALDMDRLEFRIKNAARNPDGSESTAPALLRAAAEAIGWDASPEIRVLTAEESTPSSSPQQSLRSAQHLVGGGSVSPAAVWAVGPALPISRSTQMAP